MFNGVFISVVYLCCICGVFVVYLWSICGVFVVYLWSICGLFVQSLMGITVYFQVCELTAEEVRWFYKPEVDKLWIPFDGYDSLR